MKVPPKRKGNRYLEENDLEPTLTLNESPSEKEGKYAFLLIHGAPLRSLNESPSEKEGKWR